MFSLEKALGVEQNWRQTLNYCHGIKILWQGNVSLSVHFAENSRNCCCDIASSRLLKHLNAYLRASMRQERISGLASTLILKVILKIFSVILLKIVLEYLSISNICFREITNLCVFILSISLFICLIITPVQRYILELCQTSIAELFCCKS